MLSALACPPSLLRVITSIVCAPVVVYSAGSVRTSPPVILEHCSVLGLSAAKGGRRTRWKDNCGPTTLDIGGGKQCTPLANGSDRSTPPALLCRVVAGEVFTLEISPKPIPFTAIAWVEGRGMRAPFTAQGWGNTIRTPEDIADGGGGNGGGGSDPAGQSAAARGTFDVLLVDPGRYVLDKRLNQLKGHCRPFSRMGDTVAGHNLDAFLHFCVGSLGRGVG